MVYFVLPFSLPSFTELMPGAIPGEGVCVYGGGGGGWGEWDVWDVWDVWCVCGRCIVESKQK